MRQQNTKATVPLDMVPERCTERCSPRFRPGGRFWSQVSDTCLQVMSRLSGLFLWSQFGYDYLLVTIKIRSHIFFKTTALKEGGYGYFRDS